MAMRIAHSILYINLCIVNVLLHGIGFYLLVRLYRNGQKSPQRIYMLNLSLSEMIQNTARFMIYLLELDIPNHSKSVIELLKCIININNTSIHYLCISAMFVLTGDRLMCIILGIKYPSFWTFRKTVVLLSCIWSFNILVTIAIGFYSYNAKYLNPRLSNTIENVLHFYIPTTTLTIFVLFAVIAYSIMFNKFSTSRRVTRSKSQPNQSRFLTFRQSKFFICIMLLTSSLILLVIPLLSATIYLLSLEKAPPRAFLNYLNISVLMSDFVDGLIYVFLQPSVKKLFLKTFCKWRCRLACGITHDSSEEQISVVETEIISNDKERKNYYRSMDVSSSCDSTMKSTSL